MNIRLRQPPPVVSTAGFEATGGPEAAERHGRIGAGVEGRIGAGIVIDAAVATPESAAFLSRFRSARNSAAPW
jgi:hypothetical protein